jgi:hypothetical protein
MTYSCLFELDSFRLDRCVSVIANGSVSSQSFVIKIIPKLRYEDFTFPVSPTPQIKHEMIFQIEFDIQAGSFSFSTSIQKKLSPHTPKVKISLPGFQVSQILYKKFQFSFKIREISSNLSDNTKFARSSSKFTQPNL